MARALFLSIRIACTNAQTCPLPKEETGLANALCPSAASGTPCTGAQLRTRVHMRTHECARAHVRTQAAGCCSPQTPACTWPYRSTWRWTPTQPSCGTSTAPSHSTCSLCTARALARGRCTMCCAHMLRMTTRCGSCGCKAQGKAGKWA